jgi:metal-responsive CopG/Arc/MetJ family transcriptional regulator
MRTIQITIDDALLAAVDELAARLSSSRSALIRESLAAQLEQRRIQEREAREIEGWRRRPLKSEELDPWLGEQVWPKD